MNDEYINITSDNEITIYNVHCKKKNCNTKKLLMNLLDLSFKVLHQLIII